MIPVTTVRRRSSADRMVTAEGDASGYRRRLLDGLAASISEKGYRDTTIADIVRHARTSRRTFYEHFPGKEPCFAALLTGTSTQMIRQIIAAVDPDAPWERQVRQAVEAWIACVGSEPAIMVSWIRDMPALGEAARRLQRDVMEAYVAMIQTICDTDLWRAAGAGPVSRQLAIMLLGGLRELTASTVEDGGRIGDITEIAVQSSVALLGPRVPHPGLPV